MTNSRSSNDFPDSINIESVIFDEQRKKRFPFEVNLCCFEKKNNMQQSFFYSGTTLSDHLCGRFV